MARSSTLVIMAMVPLALSTAAQQPSAPGLSSYVSSAGFPTSMFSSYYLPPSTTQEPQPALFDPILNITFPLNLTNPDTIPDGDLHPIFYPEPVGNLSSHAIESLIDAVISNVSAIIDGNSTASNCSRCTAALNAAKPAAIYAPSSIPKAMRTFRHTPVGHVLSGWDGTNPLPNPIDLFYQIVDRYSPHVIANVFFGHTHEDQVMIYYANNGTVRDAAHALTPGWIGPSVTPLTNLNSDFRLYKVDTGSFDITDAWTFIADVSSFPALSGTGPTYGLEYSTRDRYGPAAEWPADAPLNATFWHRVTEAMETDRTLVSVFNTLQGKSSVMSSNCTNEACAEAKVCYMRSGSAALGSQCPQGYGSVQSAFSPSS